MEKPISVHPAFLFYLFVVVWSHTTSKNKNKNMLYLLVMYH